MGHNLVVHILCWYFAFLISTSCISISGISCCTFFSGARLITLYLLPRYTLSMHNTPNMHVYILFLHTQKTVPAHAEH